MCHNQGRNNQYKEISQITHVVTLVDKNIKLDIKNIFFLEKVDKIGIRKLKN